MKRPSPQEYLSAQGWCSEVEAQALQQLCRGKEVLEIGVWKGRSTLAIAATAYSVFSIDHFEGDDFAGRGNPSHETLDRIFPYKHIITLCVGKWQQVVEHLDIHKFDVIYYDACHLYESTKEFFDHVSDYKGAIALHDVDNNPNHEGVKRALHEFIDPSAYSLHDRLAIIQ